MISLTWTLPLEDPFKKSSQRRQLACVQCISETRIRLYDERPEPADFSEAGLGQRERVTTSIAVVRLAFDDPAPS